MSTVIHVTNPQLKRKRHQLVKATGLPETELWTRAADYTLTTEQRRIVDEILNIDFLLGDDSRRHVC